ncbi:hypothetical protein AB6A40_001520 [Gnathostoma spinigerum]|uniref:Uncharacterized protein n=1 Tax=Gnathostoma spinigerum TaxID=75299 RepID=A0ABD6E5M9_9BILA
MITCGDCHVRQCMERAANRSLADVHRAGDASGVTNIRLDVTYAAVSSSSPPPPPPPPTSRLTLLSSTYNLRC